MQEARAEIAFLCAFAREKPSQFCGAGTHNSTRQAAKTQRLSRNAAE